MRCPEPSRPPQKSAGSRRLQPSSAEANAGRSSCEQSHLDRQPPHRTRATLSLQADHRCNGFYYEEMVTSTLFLKSELKRIGFNSESKFQRVQIIETDPFGKTLVIDDHTQSASCDEHIYHEALVHPVLLAHGNPKTLFIGGGGEGATAREILRWKSVESCVMCDIDEVACKMCREHVRQFFLITIFSDRSQINILFLASASGVERGCISGPSI